MPVARTTGPGSLTTIETTFCYRHTTRETGRACTRCGKTACSECLVQAAVGSHCLDCVKAARPPLAERVKRSSATSAGIVTIVLMAINIAVYVIGTGMEQRSTPVDQSLNDRLELHWSYVQGGDWWRLITSGFIHYSLIHIAVNMFALWQLGRSLESALGPLRFALLYIASIFSGSLGIIALQYFGVQDRAVHGGASGAVFGLLGALAVAYHHRGVSLMRSGLGATLLINVVLTLSLGLSIGGHLGGFVGGAAAGYFMLSTQRGRSKSQTALMAPIIVALVSFVASMLLAQGSTPIG